MRGRAINIFLFFQLIFILPVAGQNELLYQSIRPLRAEKGRNIIAEIPVKIYYSHNLDDYRLIIGSKDGITNSFGEKIDLLIFNEEKDCKELKKTFKVNCSGGIGKTKAFDKGITNARFNRTVEGNITEKMLTFKLPAVKKGNISFDVILYHAKKGNIEEAELKIEFKAPEKDDEGPEGGNENNKANKSGTSAGGLNIDTNEDEPDDEALLQEAIDSLNIFITENNQKLNGILLIINTTDSLDISEEKIDSLAIEAKNCKEWVDFYRDDAVLKKDMSLARKFFDFNSTSETINKKLENWRIYLNSKNIGKEKEPVNWLVVIGICFVAIMAIFPIIMQIRSKMQMKKLKKQQEEEQKKLAEEERRRTLLESSDDLPSI